MIENSSYSLLKCLMIKRKQMLLDLLIFDRKDFLFLFSFKLSVFYI